jgi:KRAB domain-containing zinc finger protein
MLVPSIANNSKSNDLYSQNKQSKSIENSERFPCNFTGCHKAYPYRSQLKQHALKHTNIRDFNCNVCDENFKTMKALTSHKKIHGDKKYTCDTCYRSYPHRVSLIKHAEKAHDIDLNSKKNTTYECEHCIDKFTSLEKKRQHYLKHHPSFKAFSCSLCGERYRYPLSLREHYKKIHENKHKQIQHYKCDLCPTIVTTSKDLTEHHKQDHFGKTPYVCDICNIGFFSELGKTNHKKNQHEDKKLLDTNNQKTISNNDYLNVCQNNNQDHTDAIRNLEQELNEESKRRIFDSTLDEFMSCLY